MAKVKILVLSQVSAVKLFEALGYKTANTWTEDRLMKKIKNLPELVDGVKIKKPKVKALLKKILKAKKVRIRMTDAEESQPKTTKKSKKKKVAAVKEKVSKKSKKKGKKKKTTAKKEAAEVDDFGRRLGTQGALIDEKLSKKGKTAEAIAKETKLTVARVSTHLRDLLSKKFITEKDDKYSIK